MTALPIFRAEIESAWIDYNGHLRDAYYGLVLSYAIDDVMDHLGLDSAYRDRTSCTLYTLELHLNYLHEVKSTDDLIVSTSVLGTDAKRLHVGCRFSCSRLTEPVATAEVMLLHVQQGAKPAAAPFPADVERTLAGLRLPAEELALWGPGSRKIALKRR